MTRNRSWRWRTCPCLQTLEARDVPSFLPPVSYPSAKGPTNPVIADLNGDGNRDVVVPIYGGSTGQAVNVFLGDGSGGLQGPYSYATGTGPYALAVGDVN